MHTFPLLVHQSIVYRILRYPTLPDLLPYDTLPYLPQAAFG